MLVELCTSKDGTMFFTAYQMPGICLDVSLLWAHLLSDFPLLVLFVFGSCLSVSHSPGLDSVLSFHPPSPSLTYFLPSHG